MSTAKIEYYPSYIFSETYSTDKKICPVLKILSLSGYERNKFRFWHDIFDRTHAHGETVIRYCLTKTNYAVRHIVGGWRSVRFSKDDKTFNEEIELLPYNNLYDYNGICFLLESSCIEDGRLKPMLIAAAVLPLYNSKGVFRRGLYEVELHPLPKDVKTLDDFHDLIPDPRLNGKPRSVPELDKLLKINRKRARGELPDIPMDRKSMPEIEQTIEQLKQDSGLLFLSIRMDFSKHQRSFKPVIFCRKDYPRSADASQELQRNPVDEKYVKISRNPRMTDTDKCRKPNFESIRKLQSILCYPPNHDLSDIENDLVWRYRFYLSQHHPEMALPKVLLAVKWEYGEQEKQAVDLMLQWPRIPPVNVLELLTSKFRARLVRRFAVCKLKEEDDEGLLLYLFQLVQALRYENFKDIFEVQPVDQEEQQQPPVIEDREDVDDDVDELDQVRADHNNPDAASTPISNPSSHDPTSAPVSPITNPPPPTGGYRDSLPSQPEDSLTDLDKLRALSVSTIVTVDGINRPDNTLQIAQKGNQTKIAQDQAEILKKQDDLATFLIKRALKNFEVTNYLHWFLALECSDDNSSPKEVKAMYRHVYMRLSSALKHGDMNNQLWRNDLRGQKKFVNDLCELMKSVAEDAGNRTKKIELLREKLAGPAFDSVTRIQHPFSFPLDPKFKVAKVSPHDASLFKSGMKPALLRLVSPNNESYKTIFKHGDDLRQDQLVLQMIQFIDAILQRENFDLRLTPYKVLATSCKHGFVQFIESKPIARIIKDDDGILNYLKKVAPSKKDHLGVCKDVMENYIRSLAGYCVITYLIGVGDRHLDNLMLTPSGHFFHLDFGFILGNDPKPLPPEIRLTRSMIDAMGGFNSSQFREFSKMAFHAFLTLRKYSNLFITLFSLVLDAGIQDIAREPNKVCEFILDRFMLNHTDEAAVSRLISKMHESVKAIMPEMMERLHSTLQSFRT